MLIVYLALLVFALSLPLWIPRLFIALRFRIFAKVNGKNTLLLPNQGFSNTDFLTLYRNQAATGKSKGAALSDLFWFWMAPFAKIHLENMEISPRYHELVVINQRLLNKYSRKELTKKLLIQLASFELLAKDTRAQTRVIYLSIMKFWARFYYELIFDETCDNHIEKLIVKQTDNLISALKCYRLRDMHCRQVFTDFLIKKLATHPIKGAFPASYKIEDIALFLQGMYFGTGIVQLTDATCQLLTTAAKHPNLQTEIIEDNHFCQNFIKETLRLFPLFGVTHRVLKKDVNLQNKQLHKGDVVCFSFPEFHQRGWQAAAQFCPHRWENKSQIKHDNYHPFGIIGNRSCPAREFSLVILQTIFPALLQRYGVRTGAKQDRAQTLRATMLLYHRDKPITKRRQAYAVFAMKLYCPWRYTFVTLKQFVFSSIMIHQALCEKACSRYFEQKDI